MSLEAPPPSRHISSHPISLSSASSMLETYLRNSEAHPHLHPDALITPTGVTFSSHGGPMGGVVMHNLRRVAAGLRGEYLEPEATPEPEAGADTEQEDSKRAKSTKKARKADAGVEEGWTDMAIYAQEEGLGMEIGEIGDRTNVVEDGGEEPEIETTDGPAGQDKHNKTKTKGRHGEEGVDKAARKKAKKERDQQRKRENAKKSEKKDD